MDYTRLMKERLRQTCRYVFVLVYEPSRNLIAHNKQEQTIDKGNECRSEPESDCTDDRAVGTVRRSPVHEQLLTNVSVPSKRARMKTEFEARSRSLFAHLPRECDA